MSFSVSRRTYGDMAEAKVRLYLLFRGYRILDTNYIAPCGEIDIIARKNGTLVFIEVRSKRDASGKYGAPLETVDREKQKSVISAAKHYLNSRYVKHRDIRFDVIGVTANKNGSSDIQHIINAFYTT